MGAQVTLVHGAVDVPVPPADRVVEALTAERMKEAVLEEFAGCDILIMNAAVSDYVPEDPEEGKIRRDSGSLTLRLRGTDDILALAGRMKEESRITVGFALEDSEDDRAAMKKLREKNCDMLVLNVIGEKTGFSVPTNRIVIYGPEGREISTGLVSKQEAAAAILGRLAERFGG
jgi:phosphopantothenoylcysteine decarboxylase/phosphopantothenate--cysteine ligase